MNAASIRAARERIAGHVHVTPVMTSKFFDERFGASVFFKCENLQKTGSFKARGAFNAVLSLTDADARRGVVAASSGNHGQALAFAAAQRGIPAWIVMPESTSPVKRAAVEGYGGTVIECGNREQDRDATAARVQEETGAVHVDSHDASEIICGQGTAALELLEEVGPLDYLVTPVGGGGLLSGTALIASELAPDADVIGAEPQGADDAYRSFTSGEWVPSIDPETVCDGLLTSLGRNHGFPIIRELVHAIVTLPDEDTMSVLRDVMQRMKLVIEPSSAVAIAALSKLDVRGKRVGVVVSGGNYSPF